MPLLNISKASSLPPALHLGWSHRSSTCDFLICLCFPPDLFLITVPLCSLADTQFGQALFFLEELFAHGALSLEVFSPLPPLNSAHGWFSSHSSSLRKTAPQRSTSSVGSYLSISSFTLTWFTMYTHSQPVCPAVSAMKPRPPCSLLCLECLAHSRCWYILYGWMRSTLYIFLS